MAWTIGIDVGGTKVAAALVSPEGVVAAQTRRPSEGSDYQKLVGILADAASEVRAACPAGTAVAGVGLAIAGNVTADGSRVMASPHLPLEGQPLREDLTARLDLPVVVENDANAAAWAEYRFGGWGEVRTMVVLTVGTGLGGGLVLDDRIYRGEHGFAGEPGHVPVVAGGRACPCGGHGCWEEYASGRALVRVFHEAGGDPAVSGPQIAAAAEAGDPVAQAAFAEIGRWLGQGLAGVVALLDPGVIVLGGGVSESGSLLLDPTREAFRAAMPWGQDHPHPPVELARLRNEAGLLGAADLARPG